MQTAANSAIWINIFILLGGMFSGRAEYQSTVSGVPWPPRGLWDNNGCLSIGDSSVGAREHYLYSLTFSLLEWQPLHRSVIFFAPCFLGDTVGLRWIASTYGWLGARKNLDHLQRLAALCCLACCICTCRGGLFTPQANTIKQRVAARYLGGPQVSSFRRPAQAGRTAQPLLSQLVLHLALFLLGRGLLGCRVASKNSNLKTSVPVLASASLRVAAVF